MVMLGHGDADVNLADNVKPAGLEDVKVLSLDKLDEGATVAHSDFRLNVDEDGEVLAETSGIEVENVARDAPVDVLLLLDLYHKRDLPAAVRLTRLAVEVVRVVENGFINGESNEHLPVTDRRDARCAELDVEVRVGSLAEPDGLELSEADREEIVWETVTTAREHSGLAPSVREEGVDACDGNSMHFSHSLVNEVGRGDETIIDGDLTMVIIEVGERIEDVMTCVTQEVEVPLEVKAESGLGGGAQSRRVEHHLGAAIIKCDDLEGMRAIAA
jgi:hypothetical protein